MKGCKNCPAYAKCTVTYRGSACAVLRGTYGLDSDPEIITNADRIRAMSDEELAKWIDEFSFCTDACPDSINEVEESIGYCCPANCKEQIMNWLRQPGEGEQHG